MRFSAFQTFSESWVGVKRGAELRWGGVLVAPGTFFWGGYLRSLVKGGRGDVTGCLWP